MPKNSRKRSASEPLSDPRQQQISAMLGERVSKPRPTSSSIPPVAKRQKTDHGTGKQVAETIEPKITTDINAQKRRHRLSQIINKEKQDRLRRSSGTPAFVFRPPHVDTRRPQASEQTSPKPPAGPSSANRKSVNNSSSIRSNEKKKTRAIPQKISDLFNVTADKPGVRTHGSVAIPGGDALMFSRDMLPSHHQYLLDALSGIESAISLLKTRKTLPTFRSVAEIVRRSTRREFNMRTLSQLATILPEGLAVLPGSTSLSASKRPSDNLILRLDSVDDNDNLSNLPTGNIAKVSALGTCAARLRRSILHKRLLAHVRCCHDKFLEKRGIQNHKKEVWHEDFDLEADVDELPAPPLYPQVLPQLQKSPSSRTPEKPKNDEQTLKKPQKNVLEQNTPSAPESVKREDSTGFSVLDEHSESGEDDEDTCIPRKLLNKVRARKVTREVHEAKMQDDKANNVELLSKLPCTMDTINSVLRTERRSAMGWGQLLTRVEKLHPKKWLKEDLDRQFTAITDLGGAWCKKVELKSSRGGYAFRVVSEAGFSKARATVSSTTSYKGTE